MEESDYWWIVPLAQAAVSGIQAYSGYQQGKAQQRKIDDLSKITPEERDYARRQRKIAEHGDPSVDALYQKQSNRVTSNIRQTGAAQRNMAVGQAVNQGLENSIISQELRRKADTATLKQVADSAERIAEANAAAQLDAKRGAQGRLDQFQLNRSSMLRNLAMQRPTDAGLEAQAIGTVGSGLVSAAAGAYSGYQQMQATDLANQRYGTEQAWRQKMFENQEMWRQRKWENQIGDDWD